MKTELKVSGYVKTLFISTLVLSLSFVAEAQQSKVSNRVREVQQLEPKLREVFVLRDFNGDGLIDGKEYEAWGGGATLYDRNNDGVIYPSEYAGYFAAEKSDVVEKKESTSKVSTGNASKPKTGKYTCFGYGLNASGGTSGSYVYKGTFTLEPGNRYTANNTKGTFSLTQKDNKSIIKFNAGAYANLTGVVKQEKNSYEIAINFPATKKGGVASTQYCSCEK